MRVQRFATLALVPAVAFMLMGGSTVKPGASNPNKGNNNNNNNNKNTSKDPKAGDGDSVKKWKDGDFDEAKKAEKPICLYIYDADDKNNTRAKLIEGPTALGSAEVKDKLKTFKCVKLKESESKGWPADWISRAKGGAVLVLASSDLTQLQIIDKTTPRENVSVAGLEATIDGILKYEEAKKAQPAKPKVEAKK